jgi:hypothetical protein
MFLIEPSEWYLAVFDFRIHLPQDIYQLDFVQFLEAKSLFLLYNLRIYLTNPQISCLSSSPPPFLS